MEELDRIDQDGHNPTVYGSYAEMKAVESSLPFDDPEPDDGCWNCRHYNGESCMKRWKNGDVAFYDPIMDDRVFMYVMKREIPGRKGKREENGNNT